MRRYAVSVVLVLTLTACRDATGPAIAEVSARVTRLPDVVNDQGMVIAITVANTSADTVYYNFCGTTLEREKAGVWEYSAGVACFTLGWENPLDGMLRILPRASREVSLYFYALGGFAPTNLDRNHRIRVQIVAAPPESWWRYVGSLTQQSLTTEAFVPLPP